MSSQRGALILAQSALRQWTDLYAKLQNESGAVVSRKLDYNLPPADHLRALEAIAEALNEPGAPNACAASASSFTRWLNGEWRCETCGANRSNPKCKVTT